MISLDFSIIPAIILFLILVVALNYLLFTPLLNIQSERDERTKGQQERTRQQLSQHRDLTNRYVAAIKHGRVEGYRVQEHARSDAMKERAEALEQARARAETLVHESRASMQAQVTAAIERLDREADEIASGIVATVLQRSA